MILNAKKDQVRQRAYRDLLPYAGLVKSYAESAIPGLTDYEGAALEDTFTAHELARRLIRAIRILGKVIDRLISMTRAEK